MARKPSVLTGPDGFSAHPAFLDTAQPSFYNPSRWLEGAIAAITQQRSTSTEKEILILERDVLVTDMAGICPKLQRPGNAFRDFVILDEEKNGFPGFINLVGIESPGLTASLWIGKYIGTLPACVY